MPSFCLGMHARQPGEAPEPLTPLAPDFAAPLAEQLERALMTSTDPCDQQLLTAIHRWRDGETT